MPTPEEDVPNDDLIAKEKVAMVLGIGKLVPETPQWYTITELAERLGYAQSTISQALRQLEELEVAMSKGCRNNRYWTCDHPHGLYDFARKKNLGERAHQPTYVGAAGFNPDSFSYPVLPFSTGQQTMQSFSDSKRDQNRLNQKL